MGKKFDNEANQFEDEYFDQDDDDDLGDFIVDTDEEDAEMSKHKHQRQAELEDDIEEEVEEEVEEVEEIEEEPEEEAPVGQQEILSLREQLKEEIRRKNAAVAGGTSKASCSSSVNKMITPPVKDRYGTFFGPSKPVLARRVIEEGCSSIMKEQQNVPSRKGGQLVLKALPGTVENLQKPKFVSEEKRKVDALRENRDYSSLFSDDADTLQPTKEQSDNRPLLLVPKSESDVRGPIKSAGMSRAPTTQPARLSSKNHASFQPRVHSKAESPGKDPLADRKRMIAAGTNGSIPPNMKKKTPGLTKSSSNSQKLQPSLQSKRPQGSVPGQRQQHPTCQNQRMQHQLQSQRPHGNGRQQSLQGLRPDKSLEGQRIGHNGSATLHGRLKSEQKQIGPSSKLKAHRPVEKRAVKRKSDDGVGNYSSIIRKIFKYDPDKFIPGGDEDDPNMEADFASIVREEKRSAKLARKEDEEQLRLIQEEERRERAMKKKKIAHKE